MRLNKKFSGVLILSACLISLAGAQGIQPITPAVIHFGAVGEGRPIEGEIKFRNDGTSPLTIETVESSCGCTVSHYANKRIVPGDTGRVFFRIETRGFRGPIQKTIDVYFAPPAQQELHYLIQATVFRELLVRPDTLYLPSAEKGSRSETHSDSLVLMNRGTHPLVLRSVFTAIKGLTLKPSATRLPPGESIVLRVQFKPKAALGAGPGQLIIRTNHPVFDELVVPVYFQNHTDSSAMPLPGKRP
ncbi:MAG: DUF1573 domain-containing protein [Calditrichaeota bacterium]|nr:MAG: DUF1573 domain-containing protein [Calditrichota bacterium]